MVLSSAILITGETFAQFLVGSLVMFLAFALISGTYDALLYEAVLQVDKTEFYDEILGKVNSIKLALTVAIIATGGLLYGVDPSLPLAAVALFM